MLFPSIKGTAFYSHTIQVKRAALRVIIICRFVKNGQNVPLLRTWHGINMFKKKVIQVFVQEYVSTSPGLLFYQFLQSR